MGQGERRIRSLKLRGPDDTQLTQLRYRLEEAFRIASLPGLPPNAMVMIRYLDLGTIRSGLSAVQLADSITETVRALAAEAICIDHQSGDDVSIVWFSDPLQPYQVLLQRLLDGKLAHEWYWRSLFPDQSLELNEQLIGELMVKACQTPVKGLAVSLLIQSCLDPMRLLRLLSLVTPALARRLLHEQGMSPVALSVAPARKPDNQELPFSESGPERLVDAPNLDIAWRRAIQTAVEYWGLNDVRSRWLALQALVCHRPAFLDCRDTWHYIELPHWFETWSVTKPYVNRMQGNQPEAAGRSPESNYSGLDSFSGPQLSLQQEYCEGVCGPAKIDVPKTPGRDANNNDPLVEWPGQFSRHAGFAYLIPLLQHMGMAELLQHHETLLAADFPRQLLWTMARRFAPDEVDSCWRLFKEFEAAPNALIKRFYAPPLWWRLARETHRSPHYFALQKTDLRVDELINSFQLVCALFLRRYCDLSLRCLVHRPGRVAMTSTHWDVMFDINQIDLRLRRVALDSDPGWVPWLGKVVQFHYGREGQGYV